MTQGREPDSLAIRAWSAKALAVWGKTDPDALTWLPAVRHLEDAAAVAGVLWDRWLPPLVRDAISAGLPGGSKDGRALTVWLAGVHDCGKFSPQFTGQLAAHPEFGQLVENMETQGYSFPTRATGRRPEPHSLIGQVMLRNWLVAEQGFRPGVAGRLASVVGAHHGVPPTNVEVAEVLNLPMLYAPDPVWSKVQAEVLAGMAVRTGAEGCLRQWRNVTFSSRALMLVAATVVVADWLASDSQRFPHHDELSSVERAEAAAGALDLPAPWLPTGGDLPALDLMRRRFPEVGSATPRPVQQAAVDAARAAERAPLLIIEAGTGEGKTEAALLAAEVLAHQFGCGGVMFALPTQATSDGIFPRLNRWIESLEADGSQSVYLAHGKAALNDEYQGLIRSSRIRGVGEPGSDQSGRAVVTGWLNGRRKGVLANMVVGTIDQVLFTALRARFVQLRHLAMAGKVVIVDEAHAADAYMRIYLVATLRWLAAHGTPVVVMSATLPPLVRQELVEAYESGRTGGSAPSDALIDDDAFPRITLSDGQVRTRPVPAGGHVERDVLVQVVGDTWLDDVTAAVETGACVAVIQNTVGAAREAYTALVERVGHDRVGLLHSQFLAPHRLLRERELRARLGPPDGEGRTPGRPQGYVICATQVIEQSLDIDADLMVSAVAPIDLLIQRIGRLHRHVRGPGEQCRPTDYRQPRLILCGSTETGAAPAFDSGSEAVYGRAALLRSMIVLESRGFVIRTPRDVPALVRHGYDPELAAPTGWGSALVEADHAQRSALHAQRERAGMFALPPPADVGALTSLLDGGTDDPEIAGGRAKVRDTDDSLEVIVVMRRGDGLHPIRNAGVPDVLLPTELAPPPEQVARALSASTVRLPRLLCHPGVIGKTIESLELMGQDLTGWQQSRWLSGELVLILDEHMVGSLHSVQIRYDTELGLICDKGVAE